MRIVSCKTNHLSNPTGYNIKPPVLSWKVKDAEGASVQYIRIQIAEDREFAGILYDSGKLTDVNEVAFQPKLSLKPRTRYFWKVELESSLGEYAVSEIQYFETAKMDEPWEAEWIGCPGLETENPVFEKYFSVQEAMEASSRKGKMECVRANVCFGLYSHYEDMSDFT